MTAWPGTAAALAPAVVPSGLYAAARVRVSRQGVGWPAGRDAAFAAGAAGILVATASPLAAHDEWFPVHVVQHLLLGMAAPLAFALAAPVTLLVRAGGPRARRRLVALLHSHVVRWLGWAPVGASVSVGSMWALYLTPLYAATLAHPALHDLVHLHMLVAGCLLTFPLVGRDPLPGRGGWHLRVAVLFAVLAAHAVLATYLYVHATSLSAPGVGTAADWRAGAQILWYGGDAVDALLLTAFFATWYRAAGRRAGRAGRTSGVRAAAAPAATAACHDRRRSRRSAGTPT